MRERGRFRSTSPIQKAPGDWVEKARALYRSLAAAATPTEAAAADIGIAEIAIHADDLKASVQLDALEIRLRDKLGNHWESGGKLFRDQLDMMRNELARQDGIRS